MTGHSSASSELPNTAGPTWPFWRAAHGAHGLEDFLPGQDDWVRQHALLHLCRIDLLKGAGCGQFLLKQDLAAFVLLSRQRAHYLISS